MLNSLILSITESKNPPLGEDLSVNLAIAPSIPSKIPIKKINIENNRRFEKKINRTDPRIEEKTINKVAIFGVVPILINPFAKKLINGLNNLRRRNREGIFIITLLNLADILFPFLD
jgi:hypothetical protein